MKRLLFIIFVLSAFIGNTQNYLTVRDGIKTGGTVITTTQLQLIPTISGKIDASTLEAATGTFYTKSQTDSIAALKASKSGDTFSGPIYVPTAAAGTNTTQAASTAFVKTELQSYGKQIYVSNVQISKTGDTNEYTALTFTIPGGTIGPNGSFHIFALLDFTSSTNLKTIAIKFNGTQIQAGGNFSLAGTFARHHWIIANRNSASSQIVPNSTDQKTAAFQMTSLPTASPAYQTFSINTAADITCTVTLKLGLGTETVNLETFQVIAYY